MTQTKGKVKKKRELLQNSQEPSSLPLEMCTLYHILYFISYCMMNLCSWLIKIYSECITTFIAGASKTVEQGKKSVGILVWVTISLIVHWVHQHAEDCCPSERHIQDQLIFELKFGKNLNVDLKYYVDKSSYANIEQYYTVCGQNMEMIF